MHKHSLKIFNPFNEREILIPLTDDSSTRIISQAVIMEKIGALWILSASNLTKEDLAAFYLRSKSISLSLSKGLKCNQDTLVPEMDAINRFFMQHRIQADNDYLHVMRACNQQLKACDSYSRDFLISGINQVLSERYTQLAQEESDLYDMCSRFALLALAHSEMADKFNHLSEMSFVISQIFLIIREKCTQARENCIDSFIQPAQKIISHNKELA